jgi:uncharacterized glyoxalase superfamily protein PhnB
VRPTLSSISPLFIVEDVGPATAFYRDALGFELTFLSPEDDPFFAVVRRDGAQIMLKAIVPEVPPLPNNQRHPWAKWDALIHTQDPDALASEFIARGVQMHVPLGDTEDRLRGFELKDPDGYVLFFGRPIA